MSVEKSKTATFKLDDDTEETSGYHAENTRTVVVHENGGGDRSYRYERQMSRSQLFKAVAGISLMCGLLLPAVGWMTGYGILGKTVDENSGAIIDIESVQEKGHKDLHDLSTETRREIRVIQTKQDRLIVDVEDNSDAAQEVLKTVTRIEAKMDAIHQ